MRLILGSASPRRRELLATIGVVPDEVFAPEIDENPQKTELPRPYCARIAREKAKSVVASETDLILCADTKVALGRRILGKPQDPGEAVEMLLKLSGRRHRVITSVAVRLGAQIWQRDVETVVQIKRLSDDELSAYIRSGEWRGKAGSYGIQGAAAAFVPWIRGSYSAVVGRPMAETATWLRGAGRSVPNAGTRP